MLRETFSDLRYRLRAIFGRDAMERELDEELRFHIERETEKYVRGGMERHDAARRARLAFGGVNRIKDDTRARGVTFLETLLQDLRYAWRGLRAKRGFTLAIIVTLGLGIGANAAMFGIVDRLLFRAPDGLRDPDRVHRVYATYLSNGRERTDRNFSFAVYGDITRWTRAFDQITAFQYRRMPVGTGEDTKELIVGAVSATFFNLFDARPALGRYFTSSEDTVPAGAHVAVLSHHAWETLYGSRRDAIGSAVSVGAITCTIIGVAPPGFEGVTDGPEPSLFIPITTVAAVIGRRDFHDNYNWTWLEMLARRRADISVQEASADLTSAFQRSWQAQAALGPMPPLESAQLRAQAAPVQLARGPLARTDSRVATWVSGVGLIVLLVACANVANLLIARALKRRREIALRLALGVTRRRLVQQLLTESLLLAAMGGIAGLVVAQWVGRILAAVFLRDSVGVSWVADPRTLAFVAAATLGVALLTGLAPALHARHSDVTAALKAGVREGTHHRSRARTGLLLFQGALSVVLLVGAGLFVRSLQNVRSLRLGYDVDPVLFVERNMRGLRLSETEEHVLDSRVLEAIQTIPGVSSATLAASVPFWSNESRGLHVPGIDSIRKLGVFLLQAGSPDYFATMGTRILRGRGIAGQDHRDALRVVIVSESMAEALWPGRDALGKQIRIGPSSEPYSTVVGIAEDMRGRTMTGDREYWYYVPAAQMEGPYPALFVRASPTATGLTEDIRRRLQPLMPGSAYVTVVPLRSLVEPNLRPWEFGATMFAAFGGLALALAAIGLYSVIAYAVAQRTHELGVRIALGAGTGDVFRLIVGQGVAFAIVGVTIGSAIALWAGRWVEPLLFSQSARDPVVFGAVGCILLTVATIASVGPALKAARVDPTVSLRAD